MTREEARLTLQDNFGYLSQEHPRILEALRVALDALSQPSLPSNLDKAAELAYPKQYAYIPKPGSTIDLGKVSRNAFKVGAEWMTQQGVNTVVISNQKVGISEEGMKLIENYLESLPSKTEIVLQIRKKQ